MGFPISLQFELLPNDLETSIPERVLRASLATRESSALPCLSSFAGPVVCPQFLLLNSCYFNSGLMYIQKYPFFVCCLMSFGKSVQLCNYRHLPDTEPNHQHRKPPLWPLPSIYLWPQPLTRLLSFKFCIQNIVRMEPRGPHVAFGVWLLSFGLMPLRFFRCSCMYRLFAYFS